MVSTIANQSRCGGKDGREEKRFYTHVSARLRACDEPARSCGSMGEQSSRSPADVPSQHQRNQTLSRKRPSSFHRQDEGVDSGPSRRTERAFARLQQLGVVSRHPARHRVCGAVPQCSDPNGFSTAWMSDWALTAGADRRAAVSGPSRNARMEAMNC